MSVDTGEEEEEEGSSMFFPSQRTMPELTQRREGGETYFCSGQR